MSIDITELANIQNMIGNKLQELETLVSDLSRITGEPKYYIETSVAYSAARPEEGGIFNFKLSIRPFHPADEQPNPDAATPPSPSIDAMTKAVEQMESITANVTAAADDHFKALGKYSPETFARATAQMKENVNIAHNLNRLLSESVQFRAALEELKILKDYIARSDKHLQITN